ncbi:protein translocase subunit SecD [Nocardioides sp. Leaf374]|uniref:protein translocase subunit SecD n=1 Tax=Nocardioides sp. Leaf374 TaxID=2876560 RepID=UPI001E646356|nr:protein translocase subunit SecD [Nocardioides sp. Leaf374]
MARPSTRPGRTLVVFFLGVAILYGLTALAGTWKPALGLDLQGGTRIVLIPDGDPSQENLEEARQIIDDRVNGSGVSEGEVTTSSGNITVEIPGEDQSDLEETVQRTAQLRFRLVACSPLLGTACGAAGQVSTDPGTQVPGATTPGGQQGGQQGGTQNGQQNGQQQGGQQDGAGQSGNNRPAPGFAQRDLLTSGTASPSPSGQPSDQPSGQAGDGASTSPSAQPSGSASPSGSAGPGAAAGGQAAIDSCLAAAADDETLADPLAWINSPTPACAEAFTAYQCPAEGTGQAMPDDPATPLITCDDEGIPYLLSSSIIEGTDLTDAAAGIPQGQVGWAVTLSFNGEGTDTFGEVSQALAGQERPFAIVLDGGVISAPTIDTPILNGEAQITGDFGEEEADSLATSLKYGSLPIAFGDTSVETIGPSLAGSQLSAGIYAGAAGLLLVMLYCLVYYRGLGLVVVGSLAVAAAITYAMVLLLGAGAGFTLTLPGIAGLIIAVGVTADSFIIFFERIRDEMREGKSMRVAVESGWQRARVTRLAANVVSLLSAAVLYIFATGVVKGFGFALGLSTLIDLAVLFWFTKPMVSYLARYSFFNGGGRLSGLSPETLGMDRVPATAGGKA